MSESTANSTREVQKAYGVDGVSMSPPLLSHSVIHECADCGKSIDLVDDNFAMVGHKVFCARHAPIKGVSLTPLVVTCGICGQALDSEECGFCDEPNTGTPSMTTEAARAITKAVDDGIGGVIFFNGGHYVVSALDLKGITLESTVHLDEGMLPTDPAVKLLALAQLRTHFEAAVDFCRQEMGATRDGLIAEIEAEQAGGTS